MKTQLIRYPINQLPPAPWQPGWQDSSWTLFGVARHCGETLPIPDGCWEYSPPFKGDAEWNFLGKVFGFLVWVQHPGLRQVPNLELDLQGYTNEEIVGAPADMDAHIARNTYTDIMLGMRGGPSPRSEVRSVATYMLLRSCETPSWQPESAFQEKSRTRVGQEIRTLEA